MKMLCKKMTKRLAPFFVILLMPLLLSGCWDYTGLNDLTIVAGMAVDENTQGEGFFVSFEIVDKASAASDGPDEGRLIQARGETIADAIRNAENQLINELYFGNMQILVISQQIASNAGIKSVMEEIFREAYMRETINVLISKENTAARIITPNKDRPMILSFEIKKNIEQDHRLAASIRDIKAYQIYNSLGQGDENLVLPAFKVTQTEDDNYVEADGLALCRRDHFSSFLSAKDTQFYLFTIDDISGGTFTFSASEDSTDKASLKVQKNKTARSYTYDGERMRIYINCDAKAYLSKQNSDLDAMVPEDIAKLEQAAALALSSNIKRVIAYAQQELEMDIFDFGTMVYKSDHILWMQIENNWQQLFKDAEIIVSATFTVENSGFVKNY